jgi:hypothetical protein
LYNIKSNKQGIVEKINEIFSVDSREKVNTGEVVKKYGIGTKYSHLDSSSLHLHGKYDNCLNNRLASKIFTAYLCKLL